MDRPEPTSSGGPPAGRQLAIGRAVVILVVAVVLGVLIVRSSGSPGVAVGASGQPTTTTTTTRPSSTPTTIDRGKVKVLVANDSTTNGVAGGYTTVLQHAGWSVLVPATAKPPPHATSSVYYATNDRADADAIAAELGLPASDVLPISPATPVADTTGADVVLVIGADLAAKTPPSTVPPTTTSTTSTTKAHKSKAS